MTWGSKTLSLTKAFLIDENPSLNWATPTIFENTNAWCLLQVHRMSISLKVSFWVNHSVPIA